MRDLGGSSPHAVHQDADDVDRSRGRLDTTT